MGGIVKPSLDGLIITNNIITIQIIFCTSSSQSEVSLRIYLGSTIVE